MRSPHSLAGYNVRPSGEGSGKWGFAVPANRFNSFTDYGVRIGLRIPHCKHIFDQKPVVERFMMAYLDACPSKPFTLRDLGSRRPSFLKEHQEFIAPNSCLGQDIVRLEWAHSEAYDAATISPPPPEYFASVDDDTVLHLQPGIRLLELSYPVDELLIAVRQNSGSNDTSSNNAKAIRKVPEGRPIQSMRCGLTRNSHGRSAGPKVWTIDYGLYST